MEEPSAIESTTAFRPATTGISSAVTESQPVVAQIYPFPGSPGHASGPAIVDVDDGTTDDGSSIDERMYNIQRKFDLVMKLANMPRTTYTASLTPSVVDYPTEYGRRYHAFRQAFAREVSPIILSVCGMFSDYQLLSPPQQELDRLDLAHKMMLKTLSGRLYLAPLEKDKGLWRWETASRMLRVPPNVKFEIDDVESSWVRVEKYDYIFCRYMVVAIADWPKRIENIYAHLNPGGWVEFQEMDGLYYSENNTYTEDLAVFKWNREYLTACDAMGRTARPGGQIKTWKFKTPIGQWAKDPQLRDVGMICLSQLLDGLEGFTLKLFCGFLDKTQEEVLVMLSQVRKELRSGTAHILVNQHVVYAQKASMKAEDNLA
ncbi:umta methyltransferase family protein [Colletotrichum camelliae]|nr:umta methyltransferase family protein [Colletotrichum camelliae]